LVALRRRQTIERRWILAAAACLTCGLFLSLVVRPSFKYGSRANFRKAQVARSAAPEALDALKQAESQPRNEAALRLSVEMPADAPQANPPAANAEAESQRAPVAESRPAPALDFTQLGIGRVAPSLAVQERDAREQMAAGSRHLGYPVGGAGISGAAGNTGALGTSSD